MSDAINYLSNTNLFQVFKDDLNIEEDYIFLFRVTHNHTDRDTNPTTQLIITRLDRPAGWDNISIDIECVHNFPTDSPQWLTTINDKLTTIENLANTRTYEADTTTTDTDTNPLNNNNNNFSGGPISTAPPADSDLTALNNKPNQEINTYIPPNSSSLSTPSPASTLSPDTDPDNSPLNNRPVTDTTLPPVNLPNSTTTTTSTSTTTTTTSGGPSSTTTPVGPSPPPVAVTTTTSLSTTPTKSWSSYSIPHLTQSEEHSGMKTPACTNN